MKIHKILTGIMASVVMMANISAGEVAKPSFLRKAGNMVAKPFTWTWGKVKTNSKKTAVAVTTGVAGVTAYASGCVPSKDAIVELFSKGVSYLPSSEKVQDLARKLLSNRLVLAGTFTALGLAYVWRTYAKCAKSNVVQPDEVPCIFYDKVSVEVADIYGEPYTIFRPSYSAKSPNTSRCYGNIDLTNPLENSGIEVVTSKGKCNICNQCLHHIEQYDQHTGRLLREAMVKTKGQ